MHLLFCKKAVEFEWVCVEKWTCQQRPLSYIQLKQKLPYFCFEVQPPDIHVKSGLPVVFLILTWVWVEQHGGTVWWRYDGCSISIWHTWKNAKLLISWNHPHVKNRNTWCFCFWPEQEMEKVSHLCIGEKVCIQWSRLLLLLFWKRAVEFEWVCLEKWTCQQRPLSYIQQKQKLPYFCFEVPPPDIHVKSGLPVVFLILTWVWVEQHGGTVWWRYDGCSISIWHTWKNAKLLISWNHPHVKNRNTWCFCFWPEQEMEKVSHLCIGEKVCIQWSRICICFFARKQLSLNGYVLRNEHANKGPFHTYS